MVYDDDDDDDEVNVHIVEPVMRVLHNSMPFYQNCWTTDHSQLKALAVS